MNILLASVGRRPYLVKWFKEALEANGFDGRVIAADLDEFSPSRAFADRFVKAPRVDDSSYTSWLGDVLSEHNIGLAVSINDFELSKWATLPQSETWNALVRLQPDIQNLVEDKYEMDKALKAQGIPSPDTWLGSEVFDWKSADELFVTKGRFGSASRGLRFADAINLTDAIGEATREVTTRQGILAKDQSEFPHEDLVIVQRHVEGIEYGLDVVSDLDGKFAGVLARRKIAMRSGETDRAESVDSRQFEDLARGISLAVPHQGTMDVDVIVDQRGRPYVIDINPRFGGGYPFSHLAGARVPHAYVLWADGRQTVDPELLESRPGVLGGKYVEAVAIP